MSSTLEFRDQGGRPKHYLDGRPVSIELGGGRVWESFLELPEDALLRWRV